MDWRSVKFDWNRARAFLVTAEEGSFSAAARALDMTQPTIGRQVAALEDELGVVLFERVGNQLVLTNAGIDLVEHVREMGEAATKISLTATGQSASIEGTVSITAGEAIAAFLLPTMLARIRREHPGIELDIVASNEERDLHRREADIAIRNFQPKQLDLIGRKIGISYGRFYASPTYVAAVGPITVNDMSRAEFFAWDRSDAFVSGFNALGVPVERKQLPIMTGNHLVQWEYCKQGLGICVMIETVGDREPAVERVFPDLAVPVPVWLVCHRELHTSRRIRLVFDMLADVLKESLRAKT